MSAEPARTPRTDAEIKRTNCEDFHGGTMMAHFARTLERELISATAKLERAERELGVSRDALLKKITEAVWRSSTETSKHWVNSHDDVVIGDACRRALASIEAALQPAADGAAEGVGK